MNTYTVTFKDDDGMVLSTDSVDYLEDATPPTNPSKTGYTFSGWDTSFENITSDIIVTATYTINTYTVTFKDDDDTTLSTEQVNYLEDATPPTEPSKTGYTFSGWDQSFENITSDITVTATYTINAYIVTFKDEDGTTLSTQDVDYLEDATPPAEPTKTGYTFSGWDISFEDITSNVTVTATYTINIYTVTFKNEDETTLSTEQINYLEDATPPTNPSKTGYTFSGWDQSFERITTNSIITATYFINTYTVTFMDQDGFVLETQTVDYLMSATAPEVMIPTGFAFDTWTESFDDVNRDITTQLIIKPVTYTFTVISSLLEEPYIETYVYQETIVYPTLERRGYLLGGYYKDSDLRETFNETLMPDQNVTVYPKWVPIESKELLESLETLIERYEAFELPYYYQHVNFLDYYQPLANTIDDLMEDMPRYQQQYQLGNSFVSTQVSTMNTYIETIDTYLFKLETINEVYASLKHRPASEGYGFELTVNQASLNSGDKANRMRIYTSLEDATVYFMISETLMTQRLIDGLFGLGLKTGMFNFLNTENLYAFSSGSDTVMIYDEDEQLKTENTLLEELERLSFNWVSRPYFAKFNALAYRVIPTTFTMMLHDHENIHERTTFDITIKFEFLRPLISTFDADAYYVYDAQSVVKYDVDSFKTYVSEQLTSFEARLEASYDAQHQMILEQGLLRLNDISLSAFDYYIYASRVYKETANALLNVNDV